MLASCTHKNHVQTEEEKLHETALKNKIKSITEYRMETHLGINQKEFPSDVQLFNEDGFKTKEIIYKTDGSIDFTIMHEYDKAGNLIISKAVNTDSSLLFRQVRSYDSHNNRKELYFYLPDGSYKYRNIASYDREGKIKELAWYWPEGFKSKNIYAYDGRKKTGDTEYGPHGELRYRWVFQYDENGNLTEAIQYSPGNETNTKVTYEYDSHNRITKKTNYIGVSIQSIIKYEYGKNDLPAARTESNSNGMTSVQFTLKYEFYN